MTDHPEAITAAMRCLDDFMAAFNARDVDALASTLNLPMVRLASEKLSILDQLGPQTRRAIEASLGEDWDHSSWDRRDIVHAGPDKVHINARFSRYRTDGSVIASYDEIDIVTRENGHWGIKCRSSFAPLIEIPSGT
jgi:hypothetical protein